MGLIQFGVYTSFHHPTYHLPDKTHTISVPVPDASIPMQTFARFRIGGAGGLIPAGSAPDGEVEDYNVQIQVLHGCGDLNGDCEVTTTDAVIVLEITAGSYPFDPAADVSGDGGACAPPVFFFSWFCGGVHA